MSGHKRGGQAATVHEQAVGTNTCNATGQIHAMQRGTSCRRLPAAGETPWGRALPGQQRCTPAARPRCRQLGASSDGLLKRVQHLEHAVAHPHGSHSQRHLLGGICSLVCRRAEGKQGQQGPGQQRARKQVRQRASLLAHLAPVPARQQIAVAAGSTSTGNPGHRQAGRQAGQRRQWGAPSHGMSSSPASCSSSCCAACRSAVPPTALVALRLRRPLPGCSAAAGRAPSPPAPLLPGAGSVAAAATAARSASPAAAERAPRLALAAAFPPAAAAVSRSSSSAAAVVRRRAAVAGVLPPALPLPAALRADLRAGGCASSSSSSSSLSSPSTTQVRTCLTGKWYCSS